VRDQEEIRQARFERVRAASDADLNALAILRARRYLARYPDHGYAWYLLGEALRALARYDEAEEALNHALRLCPEDRRRIPLSEMGHLEKQRGDYERAADWFRKAIEAEPRHASGYIFLGGILARQGRLREAEEVHRTAIETCY
jgi:cytochrome c-type biogenesis protein CcmH/NrfG